MRTFLVTGGAGFIGGCFVRQCVDNGLRVVNLDKLTYAASLDSLATLAADFQHVLVRGDVRDADLLSMLLDEHQPDAIVHFAAESHVDRSIDGPAEFALTNVLGTVQLLEAARKYWSHLPRAERAAFRVLSVSTDEVFGSLGKSGRFSEESPDRPNSPYAASKAAADHFVRAYFRTYGLPVLTTHCSNNYGPYQFPEKLIPLMILNALEGKSLPVYGDGGQVRDWVFVEDHCRAIAAVLERGQPGESYNIGGDAERTNLQVVRQICGILDHLCPDLPRQPCERLIRFVDDRPGHDRRYAIDAGKIRGELGWAPTVSFDQGLDQTVRWYLDNLEWVQTVTEGKYQRQRLGLGGAAAATGEPAAKAA